MRINNIEENKKVIKKPADYTAHYYGFNFLEIEEKFVKKDKDEDISEKEKINLLKIVNKKVLGKRISGSKLFFYNKPILKPHKEDHDKIGLDVINLDGPLAEALVLKTALEILKEEGYKDILIKLNSIGDKESQKQFKKQLGEYYREHQDELKTVEKKKKSSDPFAIYYSDKEYLEELNQNAPTPINNLTAEASEHFKKVLEYVENFNVNYDIDPRLVGEKRIFTKIIFKIFAREKAGAELKEVAFGGRYDETAGEILKKRKFSAVGLNLKFKQKLKKNVKLKENDINIHLLKIGSTAELKFLEVVDIFKKLNLPINFSVSERKISQQLKNIKNQEVDKLIILGEKEAKRDKIIIRDVDDYTQKEIPITNLERLLKRLI